MKKILTTYLPSILFLSAIFGIWQVISMLKMVSTRILPSPSAILISFMGNWDTIFPHIIQTSIETVIGFSVAIVLGTGIAFLLDRSSLVRKTLYPILITSQTIPMIALAPLLLIWFGFDLLPKVIVVALYGFFPIALATATGLAATDKDLLKLLKSMDATYWQTLWYVRIPNALPQFFSGVKIAATYSVGSAIVGEYVGAYQGLGIYMQEMANSHAISLVFAAIILTALLSIILFLLVGIIERIALPWYHSK